MKKLLAIGLISASIATSGTAFAGGPVIVEEETEVVVEKTGSSIGILPIIIVTVALCAALCGGSDDEQAR